MPGPPSMFEAPRPTSPAAPLRDYIQPNLSHGLRIWWAFYWPTALAAMVAVLGFNTALRLFLQIGVIPFERYRPILWIARFDFVIFYYAAAFFAMAYVLRKKFRSFRIGLFPKQDWEGSVRFQPTMGRTARVWWAFSWRAVVYRFVGTAAASIPLGWVIGLLSALLPRRIAPYANLGMQMAIDGVVGMFVIYSSILDENIGDFRVGLLPRTDKIEIAAIPTTSSSPAPSAGPANL